MQLRAALAGLLAVASLEAIQAAGTSLVITDPQRKSLRAVTVGASSIPEVGTAVDLATSFDNVCCSAAAGDYAFVAGRKKGEDLLAVASIDGGSIKVVKTLRLPGLTSGFFEGCVITGKDITAWKRGASYDVYAVFGCRLSRGERLAANYVVMYTYMQSSGKLTGPSEQRRYYMNKFDSAYGFVSVVNSMAIFGGGDAESGTVYAVMTTTSATNGKVYKPALHVFKDQKAVPLGILATAPDLTDGVESPRFAVASPTSFFSAYRQRCHFSPGANHCIKYPFNTQEAVTLTQQGKGTKTIGLLSETNSYSPSALAIGKNQKVLYRLSGSAFTAKPLQALLKARNLTAADGVDFKTVSKLPYISEGPDRRDSLLQMTAL